MRGLSYQLKSVRRDKFFSAFVASLFGLLIGKISEGLMVGIVSIKNIMILFMATPVLAYLMNARGIFRVICNVIPSTATFHGVMALTSGNSAAAITDVLILGVHLAGCFLICLGWRRCGNTLC